MSTGKPLSLSGLAKTYTNEAGESVEALLPVDLEIQAGEFLVVVGPSGCGKSTLLQMLAGFMPPTSGEARVDGDVITGPDIDRGMVFQHYALFPWLSVIGNVEFGLESKGLPKPERRARAMDCLRMVALDEFADKKIDELSGGMKQRVAIARAFATEPSVILMDEPFGALDALTRRFLQGELLNLWRQHRRTVVFITHSVAEALFLGDRVIVMTARPGGIKREIRIELPHPRDITADEFRDYERTIFALLDDELAKTFQPSKHSQ